MNSQNSFVQFVSDATRENNILDLVLSNDSRLVHDLSIEAPLCNSDHAAVCFHITIADRQLPKSDIFYAYDYINADYLSLQNYLMNIDWGYVFASCTDALDLWVTFVDVLNNAIIQFVPLKKIQKLNRRVYPKAIRKLLVRKRALWRVYKCNKSQLNKDNYSKFAKECAQAINSYFVEREKEVIDSNNAGKFFR